MGLAISKRIVEMMDGTVTVDSKLGEGSTFTFSILVRRSGEIPKRRYDPAAYKNMRVLVVDDAQEVLDYFGRVLDSFGIGYDVASNGSDAVELVARGIREECPYRILFVDYMMEGIDGIETTRRIKSLAGESVNIIMVSQTEWALIEEEAKQAGVDKFIPKPLFQSPILDCINQLVFCAAAPSGSSGTASRGIFKGVSMLLAEDIDINREIVISLLEETGIGIDCAENGEIALRMFREAQDKYDVVVMDVQMPVMDGLEATRRIRALGTPKAESIPIIAMTANAFAEDVEVCRRAGMSSHIGKPVDIELLIERLRESVGAKG